MLFSCFFFVFFFFNDTATTEIYTLSLHDALPIFHVNGDDPEACVWVATLAMAFRQQFRKDVVIDLVCYRRYGHNEGDDPSYTQPLMYQKIEQHRSVRKLYMESLVNRGDITVEEAEAALEDYRNRLDEAFAETKESAPPARLEGR